MSTLNTLIKSFVAVAFTLLAAASFAAVETNKANQAELETVKGVGPALSTKILDERKKAEFKDWSDLVQRVKGIGDGNAARFSANGMTVNGAAYTGAATKPLAAAKDDKQAVAKAAKTMETKPGK